MVLDEMEGDVSPVVLFSSRFCRFNRYRFFLNLEDRSEADSSSFISSRDSFDDCLVCIFFNDQFLAEIISS
uniref:Uncharacterized protein n=1 Tax=Lepeophtheirus salmonis TaxID=72036 RepID=A0A0K2TMS7_LEPSM